MLAFIVDKIHFDFSSDDAPLTPDERFVLDDLLNHQFALGRSYIVSANDQENGMQELLDKLSDDTGWCISNVLCTVVKL